MQFIVGLARPLLPEKVREFGEIVKDLGGQVGSYIPHSSYLVILDQRRVEELEALSCELLHHKSLHYIMWGPLVLGWFLQISSWPSSCQRKN